jgi:hypothetical protein
MPAPGLAIRSRALSLPKRGHRADECEDAAAAAPERGRFAVADGAAESCHSGLWARLLAEAFVENTERRPAWGAWLPPLQERWAGSVRQPPGSGPLPWYLDARLRQGAFATFLGLVVEGDGWSAVAVGDSCLFHVRDGRLLRAFPLSRAAEFNSSPWLVGSRTSPLEVPGKQGARAEGDWRGDDRLWLMTDALAHWFLREAEGGGRPWLPLERLLGQPDEAFAAWVEEQRQAGRLRDDDVTLLAVCRTDFQSVQA